MDLWFLILYKAKDDVEYSRLEDQASIGRSMWLGREEDSG